MTTESTPRDFFCDIGAEQAGHQRHAPRRAFPGRTGPGPRGPLPLNFGFLLAASDSYRHAV